MSSIGDKRVKIRNTFDNYDIIDIFDNFLRDVGSDIAHRYLHTSYNSICKKD